MNKLPRKKRIYYEGVLYHVITRGNNKEYISESDQDKNEYLKRVKKYIEKYKGKLYAYAMMDNHCHMLIEVSDIPLSKIMQLIQQTYTMWYNKTNKRSGHVFEQRYKSILCDKDTYLLSLIRYIHQNPIRANIADINYQFSSHMEYKRGKRNICEVENVLSMFSKDKKQAIESYLEFMECEETKSTDESKYDLSEELEKIEPEINKMVFNKKSLEEIIKSFEQRHGMKIDEIKRKYLKGYKLQQRNIFIREVLKYKALNQSELANFLGVSHHLISKVWNS